MRLTRMVLPLCAVALAACGDVGLKNKGAESAGDPVAVPDGPGSYRALVVDNDGQVVSVWHEKEGELAIAQGDMVLGTHAEIQAGNIALLHALLAES